VEVIFDGVPQRTNCRYEEEAAGICSFAIRPLDRQRAGGCKFKDAGHGKRFRNLLEEFSENIVGSIPWACQEWANTKAAYRFFSNHRVSEEQILAGHFQATRDRHAVHRALILMLHDTTEFIFDRKEVPSVGILHKSVMRKNKRGRHYSIPCAAC